MLIAWEGNAGTNYWSQKNRCDDSFNLLLWQCQEFIWRALRLRLSRAADRDEKERLGQRSCWYFELDECSSQWKLLSLFILLLQTRYKSVWECCFDERFVRCNTRFSRYSIWFYTRVPWKSILKQAGLSLDGSDARTHWCRALFEDLWLHNLWLNDNCSIPVGSKFHVSKYVVLPTQATGKSFCALELAWICLVFFCKGKYHCGNIIFHF